MSAPEATPGRIVVGFDGRPGGQDALAFAVRWCQSSGDTLIAVTVHPGAAPISPGRVDAEWVAFTAAEAEATVAKAADLIPAGIASQLRVMDSDSAAHALFDVAEAADTLVVVGTGGAGRLRRTFPGRTASKLFTGAAAPVVIVPWGYRDREAQRMLTGSPPGIHRVTVAFVDTGDGRTALDHGARIARHHRATLTVVTALPDTRGGMLAGEPRVFSHDQAAQLREHLNQAVAEIAPGAATALVDGPVVDELTEIGPDQADLLVCGSRGYGPVRRVVLGSVSADVVRHARIPVAVVPRGD